MSGLTWKHFFVIFAIGTLAVLMAPKTIPLIQGLPIVGGVIQSL